MCGRGDMESSVCSTHFYCGPKTALKIKSILKVCGLPQSMNHTYCCTEDCGLSRYKEPDSSTLCLQVSLIVGTV